MQFLQNNNVFASKEKNKERIITWRFVKMSVPGFVDKSQFHACRLMFAFKKHDLPWWRENVEILRYLWEIFLKPQESANARRFSFAVAGTISWTVCLCVCVPLWMQYASWHASWSTLFPYCKLQKREHGCALCMGCGWTRACTCKFSLARC